MKFQKTLSIIHYPLSINKGFTLIELLVVIGLLGLLLVGGATAYFNQVEKGQDARKKKDLGQLKTYLEDYYSDNNRYPTAAQMVCGSDLSPWIKEVPCLPSGDSYFYETNANGSWYRMYVELKNEEDPAIEQAGCKKIANGGCPENSSYNYGISSNIAF